MMDIVVEEERDRPDGAPPTYDDAMKHVNNAFQLDDSDDEV